jgi:hypothetical protein
VVVLAIGVYPEVNVDTWVEHWVLQIRKIALAVYVYFIDTHGIYFPLTAEVRDAAVFGRAYLSGSWRQFLKSRKFESTSFRFMHYYRDLLDCARVTARDNTIRYVMNISGQWAGWNSIDF